jgi:hypothetical protein
MHPMAPARPFPAFALAAALGLAAAGCPTPAGVAPNAPLRVDDATTTGSGVAEAWAQDEEAVLGALGSGDPTLALRFGAAPSLSGPDAEVEADWLAPSLRARGLSDAEAALGGWADSPALGRMGPARAWSLRLERELVIRTVREERFRFDKERDLPRAASDLVRAMVTATRAAAPTDSRRAHERWMTRRLEDIRTSLRGGGLDAMERAELEDALDALERGASPAIVAAIVKIQEELDATRAGPARAAKPALLEQALGAHAGTSFPLAVLRSRLERAEAALRDAVQAYRPRLSAEEIRRTEAEATERLFGTLPCADPDNPSRIRRAAPPPERAPACAEMRLTAMTRCGDATTPFLALLALHDHVTVALWALALRGEGASPEAAHAGHHLLGAASPEARARFERLAVVRPTTAITAGLAAEMLMRRGPDGLAQVGAAWTAFGDAPLDVIEREVLSKLP